MAAATSKCMLIAFVLAFIAAPSAAARVQAADQDGSSSLPPAWRPRRPLPCIPGLPRLPWLPHCNASSGEAVPPPPPQPSECRTSLSGLTPCAEFLTNTTGVPAPPVAACCDGLRSLAKDAPVCLCHVVNGDVGKLLPAPVRRLRVAALPRACRVAMPFSTLRQCIRGPVPPMDAPTPS